MLIEFVRWGGKLICCSCSIAKKIFCRVKASHQSLGHLFFQSWYWEKCEMLWKVSKSLKCAWYLSLGNENIVTRNNSNAISIFILTTKMTIVEKVTQHKSLLKLGQLNPWGVCLEKKVKKYTTLWEYSFFPNQVTDVMSTLGCKSH